MKTHRELSEETPLGFLAILVHLGLLFFGIAALLSGGLADDYKRMHHLGFTLHSWLGMGGTAFLFFRGVLGICGPRHLRFSQWVPYTRERLQCVREDLLGLLRFRLPERPTHEGLAGLVQTFGLLAFLWTAASGLLLFIILEPGQKAMGLAHAVKELHEAGLGLMLLFLALHGGATVAHALGGRHLWRRMLFLKETHDVRRFVRQTVVIAVVSGLTSGLAITTAPAGDHQGRHMEEYESKFYGTVESLPQDRIGTWVINGRRIEVTRDTRIKEKHGRAEPGAFTEVEGNNTGPDFIASEITVKRSKP